MKSNALIYSPSLDGHRQIYIFVMAHVLKELGFNVYVAGNTNQAFDHLFYIENLKENSQITLLDTSKYEKGGVDITLKEFKELQNSIKTALTIFAEADNHIRLLVSQVFDKKNKLIGKTVGIFMRPFYFYKPISFIQLAKFIKHFKLKWNTDERFFYEVFLNFPLVDIKLSIDEKYVSKHSKFHWLPDVFHRYAENLIQSEKSGERTWIEKLNCFKEKNKEKFLFLYFGTAQYRRGYDTLLHLAVKTNGCFIHCGLKNNNENFDYDINNLRCLLIKNGCLLETDEYITDPLTINHFFKSVSHLILPYKNFYGSSGVMLQALEFGIPVLTPDSGIIGYRTSKYNLGMTYEDSNVSSLEAQFLRFKKMDPKFFEKNIKFYMNLQSAEQLKKILTESFELPNHAQSKSKLTQ